MIIVIITLNVHPEKMLEVRQTLLSLTDPVISEPGCLSCTVYCDLHSKNSFSLLEKWETRKDMNLHIQSHRFDVLMGTRTLLREPPVIDIHTVSKSRGMETVHAIRDKKPDS